MESLCQLNRNGQMMLQIRSGLQDGRSEVVRQKNLGPLCLPADENQRNEMLQM